MKRQQYLKLKRFTIEEIENEIKEKINLVVKSKDKMNKDLHFLENNSALRIKFKSHRYQLFLTKGYTCSQCGLKASFWMYEKGKNQNVKYGHLNLYGIDKNGKEVLFTKDHIIPKSLGGKDKLDNYQVLCSDCNGEKSGLIYIYEDLCAVAPGSTICEMLIDRNISLNKFYKKMNLEENIANQLINGKIRITDEIAEKLNNIFGPSKEFWINYDNQFIKEYEEILKRKKAA